MPKRFKTAYIELTNVCNKHCSFCKGTSRPPEFMEPDLFARAARESAPLAEKACLHILGEALLHPELRTIVETANRVSLPLVLTTNGTLFTEPNAELLLTHPFRQLNVSLHSGVSAEELEIILSFAEKTRKYNPEMFLNLRLWNVGGENPDCLRRISSRFGLSLHSPDRQKTRFVPLGPRFCLHFDESFRWPDPASPLRSERGFCRGGIDQYGIFCNGDVTACCLDADGAMNFGSIRKQTLASIVFSRRFEQMRNAFYRGHVTENLCLHCTYRDRFSPDRQTHSRSRQPSRKPVEPAPPV